MKKYINTLLAILLSSAFIGCSSNNDTEVKEEANTTSTKTPTEETTPPPKAQTENKKMPKCYIKKGTPTTENMITVHVKCKNGNIPIDEATVTLDNTVKSVDYKGTYFSDYIGFGNLQPATTYKAVLEVVVGGKTLRDSVKIKTKEEKGVTPTPAPMPPKWTKNFYKLNTVVTDDNYENDILNLNKVCKSNKSENITYKILDTKVSTTTRYTKNVVKIANNVLKIDQLSSFEHGSKGMITVTIRATSEFGFSDAKIQFTYSLVPFENPANAPAPICRKTSYNTGVTILNDDFKLSKVKSILDLTDECAVVAGDNITYKVVKIIDPYYTDESTVSNDLLIVSDKKLKVKLDDTLKQLGKGDKADLIATVRVSSMSKKYIDILVTFSYLLASPEPVMQ